MSFLAELATLDAFEVPVSGPSLTATLAVHDRFMARMTVAVGAFDASGDWELEGCRSAIGWLRDRGFTHRDAAEMVKLAGKLRRMPVTAAAWCDGTLSGGQVKVICAKVIDRHVELFAHQEKDLIPSLAGLDMIGTVTAMRVWRDRADALNDGPSRRDEPNTAFLSATLDDRGQLNASLDAEGYALAVEAMRIADSRDLDVQAPLRRGQALVDIFRWFVDNQTLKQPGRYRPHVSIVMNGDTWGSAKPEGYFLTTGMTVPPETLQRILCDCVMHRVVLADGVILDHGRAVKDPPVDVFLAAVLRDHHCRWKSCDAPGHWCHAHHVKWWERDHGETSIFNLVLLCAKHHGMLHRTGWHARLEPNGTFHVTDPKGNTWATTPPLLNGRPPPTGPSGDSPLVEHLERTLLNHMQRITRDILDGHAA
jgi:hypothetical protein